VRISIFDSSGKQVWASDSVWADGAAEISFSANPFYAGGMGGSVLIKSGTAAFNWDGTDSAGLLVGTGDYLVKLQVMEAGIQRIQSKVLTVIVLHQALLKDVLAYPIPASSSLTFDLGLAPAGLELEI
jgi:hypothetical protein